MARHLQLEQAQKMNIRANLSLNAINDQMMQVTSKISYRFLNPHDMRESPFYKNPSFISNRRITP